jgi:hypothetical protein
MLDWLLFRLEEKRIEYEHFIELIDQLDPDHVIAIDPASNLSQIIGSMTHHGMNDYPDLIRHPLVDMIVRHPRISVDETPGLFNTPMRTLKIMIQNEVRLGKLVTFAMEDLGEKNMEIDSVDSIERLETLSQEINVLGGNMGLVIGQANSAAEYGIPRWGTQELDYFGTRQSLFLPDTRPIPAKSEYAMIMDFMGEMPMYRFEILEFAPSADRIFLLENLYENGMAPDVVTVDEIKDDPAVISQYKGIMMIHNSYIDTIAAQFIHDYVLNGGKLFIGGRTGLFAKGGQFSPASFRKLAGISDSITIEQKPVQEITFGSSGHPAFSILDNTLIDDNNHFYSLDCDWGSQNFQVLAYGKDQANDTFPCILTKDDIILWFPRMACSQSAQRNLFFDHLFSHWGISSTSVHQIDREEPKRITLFANYPNPFNPATKIEFIIGIKEKVQIQVFDIRGRLVETLIDAYLNSGKHSVVFDGGKHASGIYFYRIKTSKHVKTKKMVLVR